MKLPLDQRSVFANSILTKTWSCEYWSRDEQLFACVEGWCLAIFGVQERINRFDSNHEQCTDFIDDKEALAYVTKRAEEGSPLHCRALVLHMATVLKYGDA